MHIFDNIKNFLYDKNYFVNIYENKVHLFNYLDLKELNEKEIVLQFDNFDLYVIGSELHVSKMAERELLITGIVDYVRFKR